MSPGKFAEGEDRIVTFPERSVNAVASLLKFCYEGGYKVDLVPGFRTAERLVIGPLRLYALVDYVMVPELK